MTIVSPVDYMQYTPLLADVAGGLVDPRFVTDPLAGTLKGVGAVRGGVESVDLDRHTLAFTDPEGAGTDVAWDRLVFTPGSVTRLFDIPGFAEHARGLKSPAEALYFRDRCSSRWNSPAGRRPGARRRPADDRHGRRVVSGLGVGRTAARPGR